MSDDPTKNAEMLERCSTCRHETEVPLPLCNLCGLSCGLTQSESDGLWYAGGLLNARVRGGWCSTPGNGYGALDDCTSYTFSLCEWCLDWLFTHGALPPVVQDGVVAEPFVPARERVASWLKNLVEPAPKQAEFFAELERRNAARGGS